MRADMQKVVVERPRRGGRGLIHRPRRRGEDWENLPLRHGIRRQWKDRKELSDNLNPLWRYLDGQVGRPWNAVWSEICERLDFRSVLGFHVKSHIDQHVEQHVRMINGRAHGLARFASGGWAPVFGMYVHPDTGLLERGHRWNAWRDSEGRPITPAWKINKYEALRRILDEDTQLHFHRGQWYEVKLGEPHVVTHDEQEPPYFKGGKPRAVVEHSILNDVLGTKHEDLEKRYGRKGVAAISKRQISRREKWRHGLPRTPSVRLCPTNPPCQTVGGVAQKVRRAPDL